VVHRNHSIAGLEGSYSDEHPALIPQCLPVAIGVSEEKIPQAHLLQELLANFALYFLAKCSDYRCFRGENTTSPSIPRTSSQFSPLLPGKMLGLSVFQRRKYHKPIYSKNFQPI
jgi:hypothetical protein